MEELQGSSLYFAIIKESFLEDEEIKWNFLGNGMEDYFDIIMHEYTSIL